MICPWQASSHAAESYLANCSHRGRRWRFVTSSNHRSPKLVKRGITRILTPGTVLEDRQLEASHNHFLLALDLDKKCTERLDLSTGKFTLQPILPGRSLFHSSFPFPREVLVPESLGRRFEMMENGKALADDIDGHWVMSPGRNARTLT